MQALPKHSRPFNHHVVSKCLIYSYITVDRCSLISVTGSVLTKGVLFVLHSNERARELPAETVCIVFADQRALCRPMILLVATRLEVAIYYIRQRGLHM